MSLNISSKDHVLKPLLFRNKRSSSARSSIIIHRNICASAQVGLLYGSATGNTREAAFLIKSCLGRTVSDPQEISTVRPQDLLQKYNQGIIIGAPTWATACPEMRTGTAMDDFLWQVREESRNSLLSGLRFAVFGCGDASQWPDNFADAIDEVYTTMAQAGGQPVGHWRPVRGEEYLNSRSKSFLSLLCWPPTRQHQSESLDSKPNKFLVLATFGRVQLERRRPTSNLFRSFQHVRRLAAC
uniref:Flavodoxin n=1 Tax=Tetraselmis sp. GSL018 TaxID=582737 RepID=A0A061SD83_9CHLO